MAQETQVVKVVPKKKKTSIVKPVASKKKRQRVTVKKGSPKTNDNNKNAIDVEELMAIWQGMGESS